MVGDLGNIPSGYAVGGQAKPVRQSSPSKLRTACHGLFSEQIEWPLHQNAKTPFALCVMDRALHECEFHTLAWATIQMTLRVRTSRVSLEGFSKLGESHQ